MERLIYQAILEKDEDGAYSVSFPDLPGCFTFGDDFVEAVDMAADAAKTYVAALMAHGDAVPAPSLNAVPEGAADVWVSFEADPSYIVDGPVVSAAEAARELGLSAGRVTHMLDAGILEGYRQGRRTWISRKSVEARKAEAPKAGRPKKKAAPSALPFA